MDRLTAGAGRDTRACGALLATGNANVLPGPVLASSGSAEDVNISAGRLDGTSNTGDGQASDGDTGGRLAGRRAVLYRVDQ